MSNSSHKMHHLFSLVLNVKDLSKAGDLFTLPDKLIMDNISEILEKVRQIASSMEYVKNDNDQSVVEIVVSRITATIRDTNCIEDHIDALTDLLKTCIHHDLKPLAKDCDPPHAKIASDVLACIFLNYTKRAVMKQSIPVAVKFLHKGNKELTRSVSSYLPLAAIEHPDLVAQHIQPIIDSVIGGNYSMAKILPQIYLLNPERVNEHLMALTNILSLCDEGEKTCLLNLLRLVAQSNPSITVPLLEPSLHQLIDCLNAPETITPALGVLFEMASESKLLQDQIDIISNKTSRGCVPSNALVLAARFFTEMGKYSAPDKSAICLSKTIQLIQHSNQDPSTQIQILREIVAFAQSRPNTMNAALISRIQRYMTASRGFNTARQVLIDKLWDTCNHRNVTVVNIRDNDQLSTTTTGASSSTELLLKPPVIVNPSPNQNIFHTNPTNGHAVNRIHVPSTTFTKHRQASGNSSVNPNSRLSTPMKPANWGAAFRHPYGSQTSTNILNQQISYPAYTSTTSTNYYKSLTKIPGTTTNGEQYKKRTALVSPYQNRSICSSIGFQDEFSTGGLKSVINSQSSVVLGHSNMLNPSPQFPTNHESSFGNSSHPQQNLSMFKNYFSGNSGTLSSTASIHAMTNNYGSRSTTHLSQNPTTPSGISSVMGPKGLPSPTPRTSTHDNLATSIQHNYHYSQPELRHNANSQPADEPMSHSEDNHRISVFEPFPLRDTVLHFCEKHFDKIKSYMEKVCVRIPLPVKCTIEERKSKKSAKLHFSCQCRTSQCLYISNKLFTMKTRYPRIWIHLMFLALQARSTSAISSRDSSVSSLKNCWDTLKSESKSFLALVTASFPSTRDQDLLTNELRNAGFFDVFEFNAIKSNWGCFFCNYPSRALEFLSSEEPILEGCLKEKKGKWRLFKRWRTRYFTLSGGQLQAKGGDSSSTLNLHQILSLRVTRGQRSIPKAFEIFTEDKRMVLKPKDGKNASEWVQCLSVLVAQKSAEHREDFETSMYSGHYPLGGKGNSLSALRTEV